MRISRRNYNLLPGILDNLARFRRFDSSSVLLAHQDHVERAACPHAGKLSLAIAYGQSAMGVIPAQRNGRVRTLLIIVGIVLIFVESEISVRTAVDAKLDRVLRFFRGPLFVRPQRK